MLEGSLKKGGLQGLCVWPGGKGSCRVLRRAVGPRSKSAGTASILCVLRRSTVKFI